MTDATGVPARPTWYVGRAGVSALLDRGAFLTTLVGGAGCGKTTALGGWAAGRAAWHSLRADDAALPALLPRLAQAVHAAGMGDLMTASMAELLAPVTGTAAGEEYAQADALASLLAGAVDLAGGRDAAVDTTVVLDGLDRLSPVAPAMRFIEALARQAPRGLRLVVASREPMPFAVDRLRDTGRLVELTTGELVFDVDETYQLLTVALGDAAAADEIAADLQTLTSGWPSQVSLGAAWLAQQPAPTRRAKLIAFEGFDGALAETVLVNTDEPVRDLVRSAAYLPRVGAGLLRAIGHGVEPDTDLDALLAGAAPMLMPESGRPGWYRVSSTARTAVHSREPLGAAQRRELLQLAIAWFAMHGEVESALATAVQLGDPDVLVSLLDRHGADLIVTGRAGDVVAAIESVPAPARTASLLLVEGEARHSRGDVAGALACVSVVSAGDGLLSAEVARRIGKIRQLAGDIAGAEAVYRRAQLDGSAPVDEAILLGQLATVHWLRSDIDAARSVVTDALARAEAVADPRALASVYTTAASVAEHDGDAEAADSYAVRATSAAELGGDLLQLSRIHINRAQREISLGNFATGLGHVDEALRLSERAGTGWFTAMARTNRGWAYRGLGRLEEAVAEFEAARQFWRGVGSDLQAYAQIGLGAVYLLRGDLEATEAELTAAMAIGERSGDHQALTGASTLARARYASDPASAWQLTEWAMANAPGHWRNWALLTAGWLALCDGDPATARRHAEATIASIRRFPDPNAVAELTELQALASDDGPRAAEMLADAQRQWARIGNPVFVQRAGVAAAHRSRTQTDVAEARLRALGVRPAAALAAGPLRAVGAFRDTVHAPDLARFMVAAREALDRFDREGDGARARETLTTALAMLPGAPPPEAGEAREQYATVLTALARACELTGDVDAALAWHLRLLEDDPNDEAAHLGAVTTLARAGRHEEARRRYRMYTERMRQDGHEPAPYPQAS
ncbi:MAG TPA: hypothetical protein VKB69_11145 [Micromonosporaceae bacterium]|nr:hypothetical protein [Micromonosporaceae bacterium]